MVSVVAFGELQEEAPLSLESCVSSASREETFCRSGYLTDPDVHFVFGDVSVPAYSQVLMNASPVFRQMLLARMTERASGRIELPDKSKDEFEVFWGVLVWAADVTVENCMFLSVWADEYQIEGLRSRCEDVLIQHVPVTCEALEHACTYNLSRREAQCAEAIAKNIRNYMDQLAVLGSRMSFDAMRKLWPAICHAAMVDTLIHDDLCGTMCNHF